MPFDEGWKFHNRGKYKSTKMRIAASLHTFEEYGLRFDIVALASRRVENFLDDQSNGWNVQKSELRSVCALSRLWFILAVANALCHGSRGGGGFNRANALGLIPTGFGAIAISASGEIGAKRHS